MDAMMERILFSIMCAREMSERDRSDEEMARRRGRKKMDAEMEKLMFSIMHVR